MSGMELLELTLATPEENLALDEALLDEAEAAGRPSEVLRLWESILPAVVVGRSSRLAVEVRADRCAVRAIPILRRASGGTAVMVGPGCLMYAVVLSLRTRPELRLIDQAHRFVLGRIAAEIARYAPPVRCRGTSDLVLGDRKISGNSVRVKRDHLLYHGTLLYNFPIELIEDCLPQPPREPDYRQGRPHRQFLTNLPVSRDDLERALIAAFQATGLRVEWPRQRVAKLVAERYGLAAWHGDR
jgi:lipoate-protein ligase A